MNFNRVFNYKPSILGYPYFWKDLFNDVSNASGNDFAWLDALQWMRCSENIRIANTIWGVHVYESKLVC